MTRASFAVMSWRRLIAVLLIGSLLVPLIVTSAFFFPYVVPRNIVFRVVIELASTILLVSILLSRQRLQLARDPIFWSLVAFVAASSLSAIFSPAPMHSFFGDFERMGGVLAWAHLAIFFLLLRTLREDEWSWILNTGLVVSLAISMRAIFEHSSLTQAANFGEGVVPPSSSTLGNPGLLAAYLLFGVAIAGYLALSSRRWRWVYIACASINTTALVFTQNRSSVLGLCLGAMTASAVSL